MEPQLRALLGQKGNAHGLSETLEGCRVAELHTTMQAVSLLLLCVAAIWLAAVGLFMTLRPLSALAILKRTAAKCERLSY